MSVEDYRGDVEKCCRCSACKFVPLQKVKGDKHSYVCPSIAKYNFNGYSGGGRLLAIDATLKRGLEVDDKLKEIVYNCQMCGACGVSCNYAMDMHVMEPLYEFRNKCVRDGATHPALDAVIAGLRRTNSMVPVNGKRGDWAAGLNVKDATKEQVDVLYYVGCATSYDPKLQKLARATVKILQAAGVDFGIAGNAEMCCGGRTNQMGYEEDARKQAKKNMMFVKRAGVKTVITSCSDGYQAFKVLYDKFGVKGGLEVLHVTEFIDKVIKSGQLKLTKPVNMTVTYHDPCYLGRLGEPWKHWEGERKPGSRFMFDPPKEYRRGEHGVYQPPRDVLASIPGVVLSEMSRIKEHAWCCGAGGGVNDSNPEFALWTGKERVNEAKSTGAEAIVTACPWCETTFKASSKAAGTDLEVYDIVELVEKAL